MKEERQDFSKQFGWPMASCDSSGSKIAAYQYDQLTRDAAATAAAIEQSVESQTSTVQLLNTITGVINILGRALIVLGL